jgi:hypothetical protein
MVQSEDQRPRTVICTYVAIRERQLDCSYSLRGTVTVLPNRKRMQSQAIFTLRCGFHAGRISSADDSRAGWVSETHKDTCVPGLKFKRWLCTFPKLAVLNTCTLFCFEPGEFTSQTVLRLSQELLLSVPVTGA